MDCVRKTETNRNAETVSNVAGAPARHRKVDRHAKSAIAGLPRPVEEAVHPFAVLEEIKLEPSLTIARRPRDFLEGGVGVGGQAEGRPASAAALAAAASPSGQRRPAKPTGASASGSEAQKPRRSAVLARWLTFTAHRGTSLRAPKARSLSRSVRSAPAPPSTKSNSGRGSRRSASSLRSAIEAQRSNRRAESVSRATSLFEDVG